MRWIWGLASVLWLAGSATASASPMVDAYKAYLEAFKADDYEKAEPFARAALEAGEAAGSKKRGILAYNLAYLLEKLHRPSDAQVMAGRAVAYMLAGDEGDVRLPKLLAARQALQSGDRNAAANLEALLREISQPNAVLAEGVYLSGAALGAASMKDGAYKRARVAYSAALRAASPESGFGSEYHRIRALLGEGISQLFLQNYRESSLSLNEAYRLASPLAQESVGPEPTFAEVEFAQVLAWRLALDAVGTDDLPKARQPEPLQYTTSVPRESVQCRRKLTLKPNIEYPSRAANLLSVGAVVVRLGIDESGQVIHAKVLASAPTGQEFDTAVIEKVGNWSFEKDPASEPGCRMRTDSFLVPVRFTFP